MTVFVTGGSGVVGASVVRHLIGTGATVKALSRSEKSDRTLTALGADPVRGDVFDMASLVEAMDGCRVMYHIAGVNQMCVRDPRPMFVANVEGSLSVLRAADRAGVPRLVYTSSAATMGEAEGEVGDETTVHSGVYRSNYEKSKHLAELAVLAEPTGVEVVSVNPSSVQGPGRATGTGKLILDLVRGRLPALVDTTVSIVDIDDCARGHLLAALHGRPGERYLLNSFTLTMREAVEILGEVMGRPVNARFIPGWLAQGVAGLVEAGARAGGKTPPVCREMVATMRHGHRYDGSKARRELGLEYTTPRDLLGRLIEWFRSEDLLG